MEYLLKASALICLLFIGYSLFLKKETFFKHNRYFLLAGLVTALLLPLVVIPIYIPVEPIQIIETPITYTQQIATDFIPVETPFEWTQLLTTVYFIGLGIFLIQFLFQFGSLIVLLLKNSRNKNGIYTYVIVKNNISPFSFFKWIVFNPELFSEDELQLILKHEKVHVRQLHSIDIILSRLACVVFWFNPIAWLYHKDIQQNLEYIADQDAQKSSASQKDYQHLLLKTSVGKQNINLTSNFYNSLIKKRIVMLQKSKSNPSNRWKSVLVLPFFILFLMSFNTEEIYVEVERTETKITPEITNSDIKNPKLIRIVFSKGTTDKEIEGIKSELKSQGIDMDIKTLKRNKKGKITKINISFKSKNGSTNYSVSDNNGITPFYFKVDNDNKMSIGNLKNEVIEVIEEPEVIEIIEVEEQPEIIEEVIEVIEEKQPVKNKVKTFVIRSNGNNTTISGDTISIIGGNAKAKATYRYFTTDSVNANNVKTRIKVNGNAKVNNAKYLIRRDSVRLNSFQKNDKPLFIVNGKRISDDDFRDINPTDIEKINVLKDKKAFKAYGKEGKNGVIEIFTKNGKITKRKRATWVIDTTNVEFYPISEKGKAKIKNNENAFSYSISNVEFFPSSTKEEAEEFIKSADKPLVIIDGNLIGNINLEKFDNKLIKSITILKDNSVTKKYGEKGENGVIIITSKDGVSDLRTNFSPNTNVRVSEMKFVNDEDSSRNATLYFIDKNAKDSELDAIKKKLASNGITASFSKIKRNKAGEIRAIKISLSDNNGGKSSATFKNNKKPIPTISVGRSKGSLIASSSYSE